MATTIRQQDGVAILEPNGKIMGASVSELRDVITSQIDASDEPRILINFERVTMMDSSGLGTLMGAHVTATRKKGRIGVINVGRNIKNLIVRSRLVSIFEHFDTENEAVAELSSDS
jgi:anti-sigma B factor antagonist